MTSQDIENMNIHSENTEMKLIQTLVQSQHRQKDFHVECDMCFSKIKFNSAQRKRLRRSEFMKVIQESDKSCFQYTGVSSTSLLKNILNG